MAVFLLGLWTMHDIGFSPRATRLSAMPSEVQRVLNTSVQFGWRNRSVRLLMIVSLFHGGFLTWGFYAWQPYFLELLGSDAVWVAGVVAALTALATIAGNGSVEFFGPFCAWRTTLLIAASGVMVAATVGVGLVDSFWPAVALLLVASAAEGVGTPVQQAYLHHVIPSSERATVISSVSLVANTGGIGGQLGLGYLSRAQSVAAGYVTGGLVMVLALPPLLLRRMSEQADVIGGRRAGKRGPCAAQGLPQVASVDTTARQPAVSTR
jgi:MFS family permease